MYFFELLKGIFFFGGYLSGNGKSFKRKLTLEEEQEYISKCIAGDMQARDLLIEHNMRLVAHIAKKYVNSGVDKEDLISIGTVGLIKGVHTFQPEKSKQLAMYVAKCIENEIRMYLRADKKNQSMLSLEDPIGEDREGNRILLEDVLNSGVDEVGSMAEQHIQLEQLSSILSKVLTSREKMVIYKRFGLNGEKPLPQRELAKELGISRSYVSRIESKALLKLRQELNKIGLSKR